VIAGTDDDAVEDRGTGVDVTPAVDPASVGPQATQTNVVVTARPRFRSRVGTARWSQTTKGTRGAGPRDG
jgi:hypothetical protein